ncbi:MAG: hypothetical protein JNJ75_14665 [Cyclobacteriaceae bacterium]|nr:hypothetical protein [Cyclobacteriaceae bacterium]
MRKVLLPLFILGVVFGCSNLEDADPSERKTFIKFFNGAYTLSATSVESIPGGYVVLGNMQVNDTLVVTVVIETDENGNQIGEPHRFPGGTGKAIKPVISGTGAVDGYVVVGDSIKIDPFAEQAANTEIASLRVLQLNANLDYPPVKTYFRSDKRPISPAHPVKQDFFGQTLTVTDDGKVFVLGVVKDGVVGQQAAPQKTILMQLNSAVDSVWSIEYDINDRTYQNSKSLIYNNGKVIWSTALAVDQGGFNKSYISVPVAEEQSTFVNFSVLGQTTSQLFVPGDISAAKNPAFGFGVTGRYSSETNDSKSNLFFVRANGSGNIIPESIRFFDGRTGIEPLTNENESAIQDGGETITSTKDGGYIIAGYTELSSGNGKDIWLIKIDAFGEPEWQKTMGGSGDQVPSAIRELPSGEILICGTNTVGGFSSIFLIKTDNKGDITK